MKTTLVTGMLLFSLGALAQGPQNSPSMPSPNNDEMSDYQNPLPNEGNGTSVGSDRQAQEDRNFNRNRNFDQEELDAEWEADDQLDEEDENVELDNE